MKSLIQDIEGLDTSVKKTIRGRLEEFRSFSEKDNKEWFSELCFCILTANSKAHTALNIQAELGPDGFLNNTRSQISSCIRNNKHRFHNNKASFICGARKYKDIKHIIQSYSDGKSAREWLVKNIKGLGYKEASHFLRNVGFKDVSIMDRHIVNLMVDHKIIKEKPSSITPKIYLDLEKKFERIASKANMNLAELDLYMWYLKTGEVLK